MRQILSKIIMIILLLSGILIFSLPTIYNLINKYIGSQVVSTYEQDVENTSEEKISQLLLDAIAYNDKLNSKPFAITTGVASDKEYKSTLNVSNNMMGYVNIDKIDVRLPIYHGTNDGVISKYAGHIEGTSLPISGVGYHSVITTHGGTLEAKLFTDLPKMEIGDTFEIIILDKIHQYEVVKIDTILPEETEYLKPVEGKDLITLATCTPYGVNTHRLLVQGERINTYTKKGDQLIADENNKTDDVPSIKAKIPREKYYIIIILIIAIIICIALKIRNTIKYRKDVKKLQEQKAD